MYKFKILRGGHSDAVEKIVEIEDPKDPTKKINIKQKIWRDYHAKKPGHDGKIHNIIETDQDLIKAFGPGKFMNLESVQNSIDNMTEEQLLAKLAELRTSKLEVSTKAPSDADGATAEPVKGINPRETLEAMTRSELIKHAEAEEIDIHGLSIKADIINAIMMSESLK